MKKERVRVANDYNLKNHIIGKIWMAFALAIFFAVPTTVCLYYGVKPNMAVMASPAVFIPFAINFLSGVAEPILYAPMLGTNSAYLAFITGNLSNLKIPCVVKAQEICGTKLGTEENEVVATLSVAVSTLVTTVIVAVFVLVLAFSNLQDVFTRNKWITPAFTCVVYALFGSLGGKYVIKNIKLAALPLVCIVALSVILGFCKVDPGSAYLFVGIALAALFAGLQIAREKKKQKAQQETERLADIANEEITIDDTASENAETATDNDSASESANENAATDSDTASDTANADKADADEKAALQDEEHPECAADEEEQLEEEIAVKTAQDVDSVD